jgi:predicted Fe-Mo cluster-binding NifX family protein
MIVILVRAAVVSKDKSGLEAEVSNHFGKAPYLTIFDTETFEIIEIIKNENHHFGGTLSPPKFIKFKDIDIIIVQELGENALDSCKRFEIEVYLGAKNTVKETMEAFQKGELRKGEKGDPALHPSDPLETIKKALSNKKK